MRKKFIVSFLLLTILASSVVGADINEDVSNAQVQYQEYQSKVDKITGEVVSLNSSIEEHLMTIEENNSKINNLNEEVKASEERIEKLKKDIEYREELKAKRVREYYKNGGTLGYIGALIDFDSFWDFILKSEAITKLVDIDKSIVVNIDSDRKELNDKIEVIESNRQSVVRLNNKVKESSKVLELRKSEQEVLLNQLKSEQSKFGKEVLDVAERNLIQPQVELLDSDSDNLSTLNGIIYQLTTIRDNQLQSDVVIGEVNNLLTQANNKVVQLQYVDNLKVAGVSDPSRGNSNATGQDIVNYAYQFLGRNYVWGAIGPDTFDCSGLTQYVYRHAANREISRTTYTQIGVGKEVSRNDLQPGDLVFTYNNEHVGIYVGGGMYINATYPGSTVRVTPVTNFYAARRIL